MLAQRITALEAHRNHTADAIDKLVTAVETLTETINQSKGAVGVLLWLAGGGGVMGIIALIKQLTH